MIPKADSTLIKLKQIQATHAVKNDSISKQFTELNSALHTLNQHNSYDLYVRAGTVLITLISILVAFQLFYLNRKKDFNIKKAEIAGEIYSRFFDFRKLMLLVFQKELEDSAHTKITFDAPPTE